MVFRQDKEYKLKSARNCAKGFPCGASCISTKKVCLIQNADYQDLLVLQGLMDAKEVVPKELRAKHSDRTGKQVVNLVLNETEGITERIAKEEGKLRILQNQYEIARDKYLRANPNDPELKGWKANQGLLKKIAKAETGIHVLENDRDELTKSIIQVPKDRRMTVEELNIKSEGKNEQKILREAHTAISAFIDKSLQPEQPVSLMSTNKLPDTSYYDQDTSTIMVKSRRPSKAQAIAHGYIHHLEKANPELSSVVQAFFDKRTAGEKVSIYNTHPVKRDKFIDPYMGRMYKNYPKAKEVLAVAIEQMLRNPYKFMKKDPEHFAFAYDALRGNFAQLKKQYKEFL